MTAPAKDRLQTRKLGSWIEGYLQYTDGLSSPELFRKWAAITTVGACLERRVWTITAKKPTFANLFTILIGRPGIGKSEAINTVRSLITATKVEGLSDPACNLSPVDVTKASLYDYLSSKKCRKMGPDPDSESLGVTELQPYHSAFLAVTELSDLIREHDTQLLSALHGLYDCLPFIEEERRYRADNQIKMQRPQVTLLGGTTPAYISRTFPASSWDEGFMARSILIYSGELIEPDLFGQTETDAYLPRELVEDLRDIGRMSGQMHFTDACKTAMAKWQKAGRPPAPTHIRLEHYNTRRLRHAIKLSIVAAANRSSDMIIDLPDFQEALAWMVEAETHMPQIFMEMVGKSDNQTLNELFHYVRSIYEQPPMMGGGKPVRPGLLVNFLRRKVPTFQIQGVIDTAVAAELLAVEMVRVEGDKPGTFRQEKRYKPAEKAQIFKLKKS